MSGPARKRKLVKLRHQITHVDRTVTAARRIEVDHRHSVAVHKELTGFAVAMNQGDVVVLAQPRLNPALVQDRQFRQRELEHPAQIGRQ